MTPEARAYLEKARTCLERALEMLPRWPEVAGRESYLAGMHAAQALIFEKTGKVVKTHKGVRAELGRLTKDDPTFPSEMRGFLGMAFKLKAIADYELGPGAEVSQSMASATVESARQFVTVIGHLLETAPA